MKRLVVLRGNSGSGKTTVAKLLQKKLGRGTMLLSQDVLRREMLYAPENTKHPTMKLLDVITHFGWEEGYHTVIVEGIFGADKNGESLKKLIAEAEMSYVYYFDISFAETLRRHATKPNAHEFGETEMRAWWKERDFLGIKGEQTISENVSTDQIIERILSDLTTTHSDPK